MKFPLLSCAATLSLFAASFTTAPPQRQQVPQVNDRCCVPASELPPTWPECRTECLPGTCPSGNQIGRVAGGKCASEKTKDCKDAQSVFPVKKYKCTAVAEYCPDSDTMGYVCKIEEVPNSSVNTNVECVDNGNNNCSPPKPVQND